MCVCGYEAGPDGEESGGDQRGDLEAGRVQEGGLDEDEQCRWSGMMEREDAGVEDGGKNAL